jgi:hypothetical protein
MILAENIGSNFSSIYQASQTLPLIQNIQYIVVQHTLRSKSRTHKFIGCNCKYYAQFQQLIQYGNENLTSESNKTDNK